jgi:hypothetical protein
MTTLGLPGRFGLVCPDAAPFCLRLNARPAIVRMAVRVVVVVLAAAVSVTAPVPVPLIGLTVIQSDPFVAGHPHPAVEVTVTEVVPPDAGTVAVSAEIANVQVGAAACVTVTACPAIVTVALRLAPPEFAVAVRVTVPLPLPLAGLTEIQEAARVVVPGDAVQLQPAAVVTFSEELPPLAAIDAAVGATV